MGDEQMIEWWCLIGDRVHRLCAPADGTAGHRGHRLCTRRRLPEGGDTDE